MHEITLIFDVFQRAYYLRLVLQFQFLITSRARLEISHFFMNFLVWLNDSLIVSFIVLIAKNLRNQINLKLYQLTTATSKRFILCMK